MILCSLKLENFKRYKEFNIEFFEGLTGFIGKNGSGKSTIFDAVFFALYGDLRTKNAKSYIRHVNSDEKSVVRVELVFEITQGQYKIIREFRGKTLSAKAYLYDSAEELIANGSKEVDKAIQSLIGMEKNAFIHTVFASQKELTNLSQLDNESRKKIIRKLLGLEKIDGIEKKVRENLTNLRRDSKSFLELLLSKDDETQIQDELKDIKLKLEEKNELIQKYQLEYKDISKEYNAIYNRIKELQNQKDTLQLIKKDLSLIEQKIKINLEHINKTSIELESLNDKKKIYKEKQGIIEAFAKLEITLKQQEQFKENFLKQEGLLKEQSRLRIEFKRVREEIHELNVCIVEKQSHEKDLENLNTQVKVAQESVKLIENEEKYYSNEIAGIDTLINQHENKIKNLKELGKESNCPTCTRPLLDEYDNVLHSLNEEINKIYAIKKIDLNVELTKRIQKKNKTVKYKDDLIKTLNDKTTLLKIIDDKIQRLNALQFVLKDIEKVGRKNNEELSKIKDIKYDKIMYNSLQEQHKSMRIEYESVLKLGEQINNIPKYKKELEVLQDDEVNFTEKKLSILNLIKIDKYDEIMHEDSEKLYKMVGLKKEQIQSVLAKEEKKYEQENGNLKVLKEKIDSDKKNKIKLKAKQDNIDDFEKIKYNLMEFKTKINSKITPRISQIASSMFDNITNGKYQHVEVTSEFDFNIYDNGKSYPIERFSGGEVDLANLVLRIAISKTLSELNGSTQLGFLAFDEVFGSQDENRRKKIMSAFSTIKEEYRQIFLISHETEIKELFEYFVEIK